MKVAISSSLQGHPEESSPADPMDTRRLGQYVAERLQLLFPQIEVDLYNRDDFPGMGDAYIALREAVVRWGANVHVSIHQDASSDPSVRGWHTIFYHAEALSLADELVAAMAVIPSPVKYGGIVERSNVAVLRAPAVSVLVEAGFYTNAEDEAIGVAGWGEPIAKGIQNYLVRHYGLYMSEITTSGGEEEMPYIELDRRGGDFGKNGYVYVLNGRVGSSEVLQFFSDQSGADFTVNYYAHCMSGVPYIATKDQPVGGYGNEKGAKGGEVKISDLTRNFSGKAWITIHSPVALHGGVVR